MVVTDKSQVSGRGNPIQSSLEWLLQEGRSRIKAGQPVRDEEVKRVFGTLVNAFRNADSVLGRADVAVQGSLGKGRLASVPWVAFLNRHETTSAQEGVYGVLLFREDMSGVYLAFHQGVTRLKRSLGRDEAMTAVQGVAAELRRRYDRSLRGRFSLDDEIDLRTKAKADLDYQIATIAYKFYPATDLPPDDEILADLEILLCAYDDYVALGVRASSRRRTTKRLCRTLT